MARFVKGHWVTPKTTPGWWRSGAYGTPRRRWEPDHWVDARGHWVSAPAKKGSVTVGGKTGIPDLPPGAGLGYQGLTEQELMDRARRLADSQMGAKRAAIERAQAAARAQADRDAATYQALGGAQMGMISKIPANIQAIRNTAGSAISSFANQVSGQAANQLGAEHAAAANFEASQTGMAPTAPGLAAVPPPATALPGGPAPTGPGPAPDGAAAAAAAAAPAPTGPGPAAPEPGKAIGLNAQAAMAASGQMGGKIPASQQAEIGAASAMAAEGMPAVVARATQDQVAMRMSQAATEDADYRQQLIDLAATEGGVYEDAYSNLVDIESKKFGRYEAEQRLKMDQEQFEYKKQQDAAAAAADAADAKFKRWLALQQLKLSGGRLTLAQQHEMNSLAHQITTEKQGATRLDQGQQRINLANSKQQAALQAAIAKGQMPNAALSAKYGHIVDANGNAILDAKGNIIKIAKGAGPKSDTPGGGRGIKAANALASKFRGTPFRAGKDPKTGEPGTIPNPPKVDYGEAFIQIRDQLIGMGYKRPEAEAIAHKALNAHYGNQFRPGKQRGK